MAEADEVARLEYENARLRSIIRQAGDIIVTTDLQGLVVEFNEEAEHVLGYKAKEVIGQPAVIFYARPQVRNELVAKLKDESDSVVRSDVQVRTKQGKRRWIGLSLSWLRDSKGEKQGTIGVSKDITTRRQLEAELRRLSITDKLTGLYNQSHFYHRLEIEKERSIRLKHELTLALFDLDGFKKLNDTAGHLKGDTLLRSVGRILFQSVRKEVDSAFRYGGDEFTVLLPGTETSTAIHFAERLRKQVEQLGGGVTASVGICPFDRANRALQIVEMADQAMYCSKHAGGNRVAFYDPAAKEARLWEAAT